MISIPSILYYSLAIMTTGMVGDDDNGDDGGHIKRIKEMGKELCSIKLGSIEGGLG